MELQRILASNTRAAMEQVFNLYGEDAMIVANNRVKGQTEIIVALDLVSEVKAALTKTPEVATEAHNAANFGELIEAHIEGKTDQHEAYVSNKTALNGHDFESLSETIPTAQIPALDPLVDISLDRVTKALNGENYKEAADREYLKAREIVDLVKQELSTMRDEFKMSQHKDSWSGRLAVNDEMGPLVEALNEAGMPVGMRESVIEVINQSESVRDAITQLTSAIGDEIEHIDLLNNLQGVHIIAGSSGAGKTMMAGRLAKQMAQKYGENEVALISFDDVRIGAWAQTQLIGSQSGVDTFRANSIEVLMQLISEMGSRKLILIDTSGVDIETNIQTLSAALPGAQKHLLLAADASESSAKRQLKSDGVQWHSVMLSRFNGEVHPWAVIYLLLQHSIPISVAAVNPNIADQAISLTGIKLAEQALSQM
jgi:flagellar biosynthesis protein FlhF|tara:strand:+ start:22 stop:1302 length:1281 start_codon:yes stop_codon:yes gene_type:complete